MEIYAKGYTRDVPYGGETTVSYFTQMAGPSRRLSESPSHSHSFAASPEKNNRDQRF
jgi:hypothetical protein